MIQAGFNLNEELSYATVNEKFQNLFWATAHSITTSEGSWGWNLCEKKDCQQCIYCDLDKSKCKTASMVCGGLSSSFRYSSLYFCAQPQSQPVSLWGQLLCPRMGSRQQQLHKNQQTLKWIVVHTNKPVLSDCVISDETMLGSHNDESNKMFEVFEWKSIFFRSFYAL